MIEYSYKNVTNRMIIVRCIGEKSFFVEKVIFPSEILTFDAPKGSRVEIWGNDLSGLHLEDSAIVGETWKNCYNNKTDTNLLKKIIQKFIKDIEKEKSIPIIVIFPYKIDVLEHKKYKKNYYTDFFKEFEKKVNCIDLTEIISSLRTKELNKFYHSNFFGSHFTPNGNRFCANYIYKYLKRSKVQ